jgi:hypothetical protein
LTFLQADDDDSISAELAQVASGFHYRVMSFDVYDVNGYRFHTTRHEEGRPNRKTTNTGICTPGHDGLDYYGRVEEIMELDFLGCKPFHPIIFKCHWFDPYVTRRTPNVGLVEIRQDSVYQGWDVYVVAQQATQVYYLPYAKQDDERLKGWYVVNKVMPHGKLPLPTNEDYTFDPNTYAGEFFQEDGLPGNFEIDITGLLGMEVDNASVDDEEAGDEVENVTDLELLRRLQLGETMDAQPPTTDQPPRNLVVDDDDIEMRDSDDETYDPANPTHDDDYF